MTGQEKFKLLETKRLWRLSLATVYTEENTNFCDKIDHHLLKAENE